LEVEGSRLTLLPDGPQRLEALIALIANARTNLRILYYMFEDDEAGRQVRDALLSACRRGVKVDILIDGFGSGGSDAFFQPLVESQCGFCRFAPRWGRRYLLRNHQKLALADDEKVLIGGFNVSDDYFGTAAEGGWRDLGLEVQGPSVKRLTSYFDSLFAWASSPRPRIRDLRHLLNSHSEETGRLRWLFGGPTRRLSPWAKSVKKDMLRARRMDLVAAYFAPSRAMLRRIAGIGLRGEARIVTAAKSDNNATIGAARSTYAWLIKRGADIYEYQPTKLHTTLFVLDNVVHIGSANFDMRSLFLNLEMMLRVDDPAFATAMHKFVDGEIAQSKHITWEVHRAQLSLINRIRWSVAYFLVAVADYRISRLLNFGAERTER